MKKLYLLIGMPGSGKGTQSNLLAENDNYHVIRVGEKVRELSKSNAVLMNEMKEGELAPPEIIHGIVYKELSKMRDNTKLISDGYPRQIDQAKDLDTMCSELDIVLVQVLFLHIEVSEIHKRLKLRARIDDTPDAIAERLAIFQSQTMPVIHMYRERGLVTDINANASVEQIFENIVSVLKK